MIHESEYPQMTSRDARKTATDRPAGPAAYKRGEDVPFLRPVRVDSWTWDGRALTMAMDAEVSVNRTVFTHETSMHQFKRGEARGSLLVRLTLWAEDVLRVEFTSGSSFRGERGSLPPETRMLIGTPEPVDARFAESEDVLTLSTAKMTVRVDRNNPRVRAYDASGAPVFAQKRAELFTSDVFDLSIAAGACAFDSFELWPGEQIYGLGERFDHVGRRGVGVDFWNKDAIGTSSPRTYINVPFAMSTRGWGVFVNGSRRMEWEVGTLDAGVMGVAVEDGQMDYFVMLSGDPAAI
ncbi:MAG: DUF4968 domain-containing protein, partial [Clostridiales bacterium]|nr:DUF4968 domain-containing protein [Clostridiales bacterium]